MKQGRSRNGGRSGVEGPGQGAEDMDGEILSAHVEEFLTKARKAAAVLFLVWTGISGGILISLAVIDMGIKGSILCITGMLPQFIFYIPAYLVLLWYAYIYPGSQWNRQKTIFISFMMAVGLILEIYVNPLLVRAFISTL